MALATILSQSTDTDQIISDYFHHEMTNELIILFLAKYHNAVISLATLKRKLKKMNLRRRVRAEEQERLRPALIDAVATAVSDSGSALGMHMLGCPLIVVRGLSMHECTCEGSFP